MPRTAHGVLLLAAVAAGCSNMPWQASARKEPVSDQDAAAVDDDDKAQYRLAVDLVMDLRYAEAEEMLTGLVERFAEGGADDYAAGSLFWYGYCAEKLGRTGDALGRYDRVLDRYPGTRAAEQAAARKAAMARP